MYSFESTDNFGTIRIFDLSGKLIRKLVLNDLFGMEGFYTWDGTDDKGLRINSGVYIIVIEVVNTNGTVKKYKRSCTLTRKY
jgi:flagellar hook assembly protein FlgD